MIPSKTYRVPLLIAVAVVLTHASVAAAAASPTTEKARGPVDPLCGLTLADLSNSYALGETMSLTEEGRLLAQASSDDVDLRGDVLGYEPKSPRRAFLQSFFIPGWGQWYNGSRIKPFLFVGLEVAGWLGWSSYRGKGKDKEDLYEAYADDLFEVEPDSFIARWDYNLYQNGLEAVYDISLDTLKYKNPNHVPGDPNSPDSLIFSHHVYPDANGNLTRDQTYYENIGKYEQFAFGWIDWNAPEGDSIGTPPTEPKDTIGVNFTTPYRRTYLHMRDDSNKEFKRATTVLILTMGNHLLSAIEAAWSARRYNRTMDKFGTVDADLRLTRSGTSDKLRPTLTLTYRF